MKPILKPIEDLQDILINCENCGREVLPIIEEDKSRNVYWFFCSDCDEQIPVGDGIFKETEK